MAFVATYTPVSAGSSFTKNVTSATPNPLGLGARKSETIGTNTVRMGGMSSYSRRLLFGDTAKDYTGTNPKGSVTAGTYTSTYRAPPQSTPATFQAPGKYVPSTRAGAPLIVQYRHDAATDTVKPRGSGKADAYMASCVKYQYKAMANPAGVYSTACTEGTTKLQSDESRELANLNEFRMIQRSPIKRYVRCLQSVVPGFALLHV